LKSDFKCDEWLLSTSKVKRDSSPHKMRRSSNSTLHQYSELEE
jgi:hypothetical protein